MRMLAPGDRILINGRTGSGKTTGAVWILSQANFNEVPWIVFNHKRTKIIDEIPGAQHVPNSYRPKKPGIYIYHPIPDLEDEEVEDLMWYVWGHEHVGLYIDEGYMINPRSPALNALYTQGREKKITMITLSQRPSRISRFAISESEFFMLFHVTDKEDRKRLQGYIPTDLEKFMGADIGEARLLPEYHSLYYDVAQHKMEIIRPVPSKAALLEIFRVRLGIKAPDSENQSVHKIVLI